MTLVVPFDGSDLSEAALVRAAEFGSVFDEEVVAVTVIPKANEKYARERDWIGEGENFDLQTIVSNMSQQVNRLDPSADFRYQVAGRYAPSGSIAKRLRKVAREEDASMVFLGSENAGHLVSAVSSVGSSVAADRAYDVVIVRDQRLARTTNRPMQEN